jgi:hypothetical protein
MMEILKNIVPVPTAQILPTSVFLDYEPWIRFMVDVEDSLERDCERRVERSRRVTRSKQGHYERCINLSSGQLDMMRSSRLG